MSEVFSLYIVGEEFMPADLADMDDAEMYAQITSAIETNGKLHQVVEMTEDDFVGALESIDTLIEGNRLLPNNAMNNSPYEILGRNSDSPFLGYFSPAQVQELFYMFEGLDEDHIDTIESVETHSEVFEAFRSAVSQALDYEHALAVIHA